MMWIDLEETNNKYQINYLGQIRHSKSKKIRKPSLNSCGYYVLSFQSGDKTKISLYHRLIAKYFIPNPMSLPCVNHLDGNKLNNSINNLEWCSHQENMVHAGSLGLMANPGRRFKNTCTQCNELFIGTRVKQMFCSKACWQKYNRQQNGTINRKH